MQCLVYGVHKNDCALKAASNSKTFELVSDCFYLTEAELWVSFLASFCALFKNFVSKLFWDQLVLEAVRKVNKKRVLFLSLTL